MSRHSDMFGRAKRHGLLRAIAAGALAFFLLALLAEHLLDASLSPAGHEISEYVHGPAGWLMTLAFLSWSLSLACSAALLLAWPSARRPWLSAALFLAALGLLLSALFATETSAGRLAPGVSLSTGGALHDVGSGLTSVALLAAVLIGLLPPASVALRRASVLALAVALPGYLVLLAVGQSVGGIRQRLLVLVACAWQTVLLASADAQAKSADAEPLPQQAAPPPVAPAR